MKVSNSINSHDSDYILIKKPVIPIAEFQEHLSKCLVVYTNGAFVEEEVRIKSIALKAD